MIIDGGQMLVTVATLIICYQLTVLYRRGSLTLAAYLSCLIAGAHGLAFSVVIFYRRYVLELIEPSVFMTSWSIVWRVQALFTIVFVLQAFLVTVQGRHDGN